MFDGHGSDESRDKAEKASRRGSKDFYPSLLLKCCCALWSFFAVSTWTSSISHMGFKKRHTHKVITSFSSACHCDMAEGGYQTVSKMPEILPGSSTLVDNTPNSVECPRVFQLLKYIWTQQLLSHWFVWIGVFLCFSLSPDVGKVSNNCQLCSTKMCLRKLLWA